MMVVAAAAARIYLQLYRGNLIMDLRKSCLSHTPSQVHIENAASSIIVAKRQVNEN